MAWSNPIFTKSKRCTLNGLVVHSHSRAPMLGLGEKIHDPGRGVDLPVMSFDLPDECWEVIDELGVLRRGESHKDSNVAAVFKELMILAYPGTGAMAEALPVPNGRRKADCGPIWMVADAARARVHHSLSQAFAENRVRRNFELLRRFALARWGEELAYCDEVKPPGWSQDRTAGSRLAMPGAMQALQDANTVTSFELSRALGRHLWLPDFDAAHPPMSAVVWSDGTFIPAITDVRLDTIGGVSFLIGSTTRDPRRARLDPSARTQRQPHGTVPDGSGLVPITSRGAEPYSRVVHRTEAVEDKGGEAAAVKRMLPAILHASGGNVRGFGFDGALQDHHKDQLLEEFGIIVVSSMDLPTNVSHKAVRESMALAGENPLGAKTRTRAHSNGPWMDADRARAKGHPSPEASLTKHAVLGTVRHDTTGGLRCQHHLAVDDGRLWEIDNPAVAVPRRLREVPLNDGRVVAAAAGHYLRYQADIACRQGNGSIWIDTRPTSAVRTRATGYLRPDFVGTDSGYGSIGKRSDTEAFHDWYQDTLPNRRHARKDPLRQQSDHLFAGLVTNAVTWGLNAGIAS